MTDMSGKPGGSGGPDGSSGEDVWLPYPETSALPDVGKIMKDLGIESTVPQGIPESGSPDVSVKPGGLGFDSFFGPPGGDLGFPSCPTSGEFPNVDKIMKDLSIESPVSEGIPEYTSASPNAPDPPVRMCGFGFREEMLSKNQEPDKNKNLPDASKTTCEKKMDLEDPKKNPKTGKAL